MQYLITIKLPENYTDEHHFDQASLAGGIHFGCPKRLIFFANWFNMRVQVVNHEGDLVKEYDYKNNAQELCKTFLKGNFANYRKDEKAHHAAFTFTVRPDQAKEVQVQIFAKPYENPFVLDRQVHALVDPVDETILTIKGSYVNTEGIPLRGMGETSGNEQIEVITSQVIEANRLLARKTGEGYGIFTGDAQVYCDWGKSIVGNRPYRHDASPGYSIYVEKEIYNDTKAISNREQYVRASRFYTIREKQWECLSPQEKSRVEFEVRSFPEQTDDRMYCLLMQHIASTTGYRALNPAMTAAMGEVVQLRVLSTEADEEAKAEKLVSKFMQRYAALRETQSATDEMIIDISDNSDSENSQSEEVMEMN